MMSRKAVDQAALAWLRERNPGWDDADARLQVIRTRVIDEHPLWLPGQVDAEACRLLDEQGAGRA
jgi:hypothetical protein